MHETVSRQLLESRACIRAGAKDSEALENMYGEDVGGEDSGDEKSPPKKKKKKGEKGSK
jgi:hypothetical protein